jgi:hypothetical protein
MCVKEGTATVTTMIDSDGGIQSTIEQLQSEIPGLQFRKQQLEQELAAATRCLEAAQTAVASLQSLYTAVPGATEPAVHEERAANLPRPQAAQGRPGVEDVPHRDTPAPAPPQPKRKTAPSKTTASKTASRKTGATAQRPASGTAKKAARKAVPAQRAKGLTDGVVKILEEAKSAMKAGEVNQALGRPDTSGQIEAVRGTLERLVKTSRAQRAGRGLYQAAAG